MNTSTIKFKDVTPNGHNIVVMGISDLAECANEFAEFVTDNKIANMAPTGVYKILDNVKGDDGRTDWLVEFPENVNFNPMARLMFGDMLKWTEDFIANYHNDYRGHNSYLDEDEGPEFDGAGFTEADRDKYSLVGVDGNAYAVMGYVMTAMRECKMSRDEIDAYQKRATSGDYDNLLAESMKMVGECNEVARNNG